MIIEKIQIVKTIKRSFDVNDNISIYKLLDIIKSIRIPIILDTTKRNYRKIWILSRLDNTITISTENELGKEKIDISNIERIRIETEKEVVMPWDGFDQFSSLEI
mgnify:CR=1 FL=1